MKLEKASFWKLCSCRTPFLRIILIIFSILGCCVVFEANWTALEKNQLSATMSLIDTRNELSRRLNQKQHELAILQCERAEKEKTGEDNVVSSGGWCIRNSSEKDGEFAVPTGIHRTDVTLANAYSKFFKGQRVASFGDGPGRYKAIIDKLKQVKCYDSYDGAPFSESLSDGRVKYLDLSIPQYDLPVYDYIISMEVAEHVPAEYESIYIDNLVRHAKKGIVLSWAVPGQPGTSHVNCKSFEDVVKIMAEKGFRHDNASSNYFKEACTYHWLKKNVNLFRRKIIETDNLMLNA